jgi:hypothetical protein
MIEVVMDVFGTQGASLPAIPTLQIHDGAIM